MRHKNNADKGYKSIRQVKGKRKEYRSPTVEYYPIEQIVRGSSGGVFDGFSQPTRSS